jgi:hypothetical protein
MLAKLLNIIKLSVHINQLKTGNLGLTMTQTRLTCRDAAKSGIFGVVSRHCFSGRPGCNHLGRQAWRAKRDSFATEFIAVYECQPCANSLFDTARAFFQLIRMRPRASLA